jgi:hypothetical protein
MSRIREPTIVTSFSLNRMSIILAPLYLGPFLYGKWSKSEIFFTFCKKNSTRIYQAHFLSFSSVRQHFPTDMHSRPVKQDATQAQLPASFSVAAAWAARVADGPKPAAATIPHRNMRQARATSHIWSGWSSRGFRCCRLVSRVSLACRCLRASLDTFVVAPRRNEPDPSGTPYTRPGNESWRRFHPSVLIPLQYTHPNVPDLKSGARMRCESHVNLTLRQPIYSHHQ